MTRINSRKTRQSLTSIFAAPIMLALASLVGLILALTDDGWQDLLSALLLFIPIGVLFRAWMRQDFFFKKPYFQQKDPKP